MFIGQLRLNDFRNIQGQALELSPTMTVFHGDNGQGKTNLLESIYLLATLKSFRGARNADLRLDDAGDVDVAPGGGDGAADPLSSKPIASNAALSQPSPLARSAPPLQPLSPKTKGPISLSPRG